MRYIHTPRGSPNVNCGLWVILMCYPRFIDCNKCPTLVRGVDSERRMVLIAGDRVFAGEGIYGNSVLSAQFCCEPKTALKHKVYF